MTIATVAVVECRDCDIKLKPTTRCSCHQGLCKWDCPNGPLDVDPDVCEADRYDQANEAYDGVCLTPLRADGTCPRGYLHA